MVDARLLSKALLITTLGFVALATVMVVITLGFTKLGPPFIAVLLVVAIFIAITSAVYDELKRKERYK